MNTLGKNRTFPIYKSDGTSFHDLVLHKSTCESIVMSLGDKITGDVYYKDNTLAVTMQEYIKFKVNPDDANEDEVKYVLVSPPTVIREGMVSDNSELKGMTKYSFTFYHPMYMLGNFPFTDIAVLPDQEKNFSQNKTFNWIGSLAEFVAKLNKNLENTEWVVSIASSVVLSKRNEIPEKPLSFDKQYVSDAVKTCYDTWKVPFTISPIKNGETHYNQGKRFLIQFGNPTEAIYEVDEHGQKTSTEYIFRFGQGVGLKNNSRTPRNNKIVTRIVGYGSERNIPYGYPQIPWYGNQDWDYTVDNDPNDPNSYPIYWGIYGGQYIKLIKHPFTRTTLMPSVYSQDVFNKVSPYIQGGAANVNYDPSIEIHDYYDAIDDQTHLYPNNVNPLAPSVEIHQFEDEYPHLLNMKIKAVEPYNDKYEYDNKKYTKITLGAFNLRITADMQATSNMNERAALGRLQNAINGSDTEFHEITNHASSYVFQCDASKVGDIWYVEYTSDNVNYNYAASNSFPVVKWDDTMDKDGNYNQSYFKITLPRLTFDLYACASIMEQMDINMRSGDCLGCTFQIQVDWDDYKANFYRADGTFDPVIHTSPNDGHVRDGIKYPDSSVGSIEIIVQKDIDTFGKLMPNTYQQPKGESAEGENDGDQFVILGISLPLSYITEAEERLDESMKQYMLENNVHYYDYPLKFDEHFLAENTGILAQIQNNVKVKFQYGGSITSLFIKQVVIKFGEKVLPQYDITLTDDIEVVMSKLGQTTEDVSKLRVQMSELQKYYSENIINEINDKLSRVIDDVCLGRITFQQGLDSIGNTIFHEDARSADYSSGLGGRGWRVDKLGNAEFESVRIRSFLEVIELLINRQQAQEGDTVFSDNDQIDRVDRVVDENDGSVSYILSIKEKWDGYVTSQMYGNILKGVINTLAAKQSGVSDESGSSQGQGSDDGGNEFYTSWMHVVGTNATEPSLGVNQIRVVLYGDSDVPSQKNFAPCELMVIARRGCINYATPSSPQSVKDSIERRQRFFEISVTEGRVTKYTNVDRPVIQNGSYGVTIGELPDFVKRYAAVSRVLAQVGEHTDWLYAQGIVVGNMIKIDREGNLEVNYVDCGAWVDGSQIQEPTPRHGVYYYNTWNETAQQQETHDVWHNNAKWRCLQNQPVTVGGVTTYYEPSDANSEYWLKLEEGAMGDSPVYVYSNNENDSVGLTYSGMVDGNQTITSNVYAYRGSDAIQSFQVHVYDGTESSANEYSAGVEKNGVTVSWRIGVGVVGFSMLFRNGYDFSQISKKVFLVKIIAGSDVRYVRINVNLVKAAKDGDHAVLWKVVTNYTEVVKKKDGSYVPSQSISCLVVKSVGGQTSYPSSGFTLQKSLNGGEWTTIATSNTTNPSDITTNLRYRVLVDQIEMDLQTVSLVSDGEDGTSPYFADLDNEMDSVPCTNSGVPTSAYDQTLNVGLWHGSNQMSISSMSYKVNNGTTYSDSRTIDGITVTPSPENKTIRIQVANSTTTTLAEHNDIEIIVEGSGSVSKELHFTLNGVRAGSNGENAVIYNLKPSPDSINVAREDNGSYAPSSASIKCGYVKNDGGVMTESPTAYGLIDNTYRVYFRIKSRSTHAWSENYGLCTAAVGGQTRSVEAVEFVLCSRKDGVANFDSPISEATLSSNYNIIDRETVLIVADGMKGNDGDGSTTAYATPSQITVQCDGSGSVVSQSDNPVDFSLKVGGETATITEVTYGTLPNGVSIIGSSGTSRTIRITTSATASSMSNGVTFTVTGTYDGETFSAPVTVALIGTKQGDTVWNQTAYKYFMDGETLDKPTKTSGITPATTDFYNDWYSTPQNTKSVTKNTYVNNSGLNTDIGDMSVWRDLVSTDEEYGVYGAGWRVARGNQSDSSNSKHVIDKVCFTPTSNNEYFVLYIAADAEMGYDGVFVSDINPSSYSESNWDVSSLSTHNRTANSVLKIVINVTNKKNTLCWFYITYKKDESGYAGNDSGYYKLEKSIGFSVYSSFATIQNGSVVGTWSNAEKWQGSDGKMGRSYYCATEFDKNNTTDVFVVSNAQAPYFKTSENSYYVFNYNANGGYTMAQMWSISNGSFNNEPWEVMTNDFKYLITEAVFGEYAHFGANIINADYRYSQYGFMRGFGEIKANISDSSQYKNIDPNDPFGIEEFLDDSRKIRNESFVDYEMLTPNHYSIVGCLIEFSSSSSSSYGHSIYQSGDAYFRYKTKSATQWGSWIAFGSGSYSFAISNNKNDTSSSTSSFSWQTYPPMPTASQPYLWLKTGSSSCMRVSSKVANFTLEKNEWYTIEIGAEYADSMNLNVRIGNNTRGRYIVLLSNMKKYELTDNDRTIVCYAIFKYEGVTINDANVWLSSFDGYVNFVAVYKAQFVPYLCEDLKVGKLVVNDIVARGELHGESLYFKHAIAFHRVYVHDESILSIPHAHDNEITTIVLPSPTESNGRVIEVYSGLEDNQNWSPTWDGASSGDYFRSFVCNTGGVGAGGTWDATYVKFWSDGDYWYVLKAERAVYDYDNDRHLIQLISKTH